MEDAWDILTDSSLMVVLDLEALPFISWNMGDLAPSSVGGL